MGRETKILLGFLATLLGVFLGVLSMKLLVPRPPAGAGPDVHADVATAEPHELVEPPGLDDPIGQPSADELGSSVVADPPFPPPRDAPAVPPPAAPRDPFVARTSFTPDAPSADDLLPAATVAAVPPSATPIGHAEPGPAAATGDGPPPIPGTAYVARAGDSWWSLAEAVYGDGRLYRALFAWNRTVDPRVSLVPGTSLELPPLHRLQTAWPALVPPP